MSRRGWWIHWRITSAAFAACDDIPTIKSRSFCSSLTLLKSRLNSASQKLFILCADNIFLLVFVPFAVHGVQVIQPYTDTPARYWHLNILSCHFPPFIHQHSSGTNFLNTATRTETLKWLKEANLPLFPMRASIFTSAAAVTADGGASAGPHSRP